MFGANPTSVWEDLRPIGCISTMMLMGAGIYAILLMFDFEILIARHVYRAYTGWVKMDTTQEAITHSVNHSRSLHPQSPYMRRQYANLRTPLMTKAPTRHYAAVVHHLLYHHSQPHVKKNARQCQNSPPTRTRALQHFSASNMAVE